MDNYCVNENEDWSKLAPEEKKRRLFLKQKALLDTFREHNAISQAQYDKSLNDLKEKMGIEISEDEVEN